MSRGRIRTNERYLTVGLLVLALSLSACSQVGQKTRSDDVSAVKDRAVSASGPQIDSEVATPGQTEGAGGATGAMVSEEAFDRKIVKTADLGIASDNVRHEAERAQQVATRFGGTVVSAQTYRADSAEYSDLILSVPSERFEDALDELRGLGEEVTTDTVSGEDVTEEYVDLRSRERNLLAAEQSLLDLYDRADDVEDALSIQRELTGVRGEIEQVQGRVQYLEHSSEMSRISLSIQPVASPPKSSPAWDPAHVVANAWSASLTVLQGLTAAILSTLVFGWWIIPPLALGAWWLRRQGFAPQAAEPEGDES